MGHCRCASVEYSGTSVHELNLLHSSGAYGCVCVHVRKMALVMECAGESKVLPNATVRNQICL